VIGVSVLVSRRSLARSPFIGMVVPWAGVAATPPAGWLFCAGQNLSRTAYPALFAVLARSTAITIAVATPAVVTWTAHGLGAGDPVVFRTSGALPTGLTAGTVYYVIAAGLAANSFEVSTTPGGAAINTSGSQSGSHTGWYAPFGDGDGATTFGMPDLRGRVVAGLDNMAGASANRLTGVAAGGVDGDVLGGTGGEEAHVSTLTETASHAHTWGLDTVTGANALRASRGGSTAPTTPSTSSVGGDGAHNNVQPAIVLSYLIFAGA
jgi:microcystin-dependent protein